MQAVTRLVAGTYPGEVCLVKGVPDVHLVTRYEFGAGGKLARSSSTRYCGNPPATAFR